MSAFLTVRVGVSRGAMIKVEARNIKSAVGNECGEIAHSAGPAVSLMTSLSCGFHENQTSSHSCFHTKPSDFCDLNAFLFPSTTTKLIVWLFLHGRTFHLIICESLDITHSGRANHCRLLQKAKCHNSLCRCLSVVKPCQTSPLPFLVNIVERHPRTCFV